MPLTYTVWTCTQNHHETHFFIYTSRVRCAETARPLTTTAPSCCHCKIQARRAIGEVVRAQRSVWRSVPQGFIQPDVPLVQAGHGLEETVNGVIKLLDSKDVHDAGLHLIQHGWIGLNSL